MKLRSFLLGLFALGAAAPAGAEAMSVVEAHAQAAASQILMIDVRTPEEWAETGVPVNAARANFRDPDFLSQVKAMIGEDTSRAVALICRSGNRSGQAAENLRAAGYAKVFNVTSGVSMAGGWLAENLPVAPVE